VDDDDDEVVDSPSDVEGWGSNTNWPML
jgi:hypothetical protein